MMVLTFGCNKTGKNMVNLDAYLPSSVMWKLQLIEKGVLNEDTWPCFCGKFLIMKSMSSLVVNCSPLAIPLSFTLSLYPSNIAFNTSPLCSRYCLIKVVPKLCMTTGLLPMIPNLLDCLGCPLCYYVT